MERRPHHLGHLRADIDTRMMFVGNGMISANGWRNMSRRPNGQRGDNIKKIDAELRALDTADRTTREGLTRAFAAQRNILEITERAMQRRRDPYDLKLLQAITARLIETVSA